MSILFPQTISPLTKTKRRIIFYLAILVFFILAPLIILYSIGYTVDVKTRTILSTGGIFVKTNQAGFKLYINNTLERETSFLSTGALVTDLKPDLYVVRIEKEGFRSWQRVVHVERETISEFRSALLFPKNIREKELLDLSRRGLTVDTFHALQGSPWVILRTPEKRGLTYLFNRASGLFDAVETFSDFRWDPVGKRLLVKRENPVRWSLVLLAQGRLREEQMPLPRNLGTIVSADFTPGVSDEFFILNAEGALYQFSKTRRSASPILSDIHSFSPETTRLLFVTGKGFFASADLDGKNVENYGHKGLFLTEKPAQMQMSSKGDVFVIDSGGGFFLRQRDEPEIAPISGNVLGAEFSASGDKILFWSTNIITVMWLEDELRQPLRKAGTRERILSLPDGALQFAHWYGDNETHIIFAAGKFVGVTDLDTRGDGTVKALLLDNAEGFIQYRPEANEVLRGHKSFLWSTKIQ